MIKIDVTAEGSCIEYLVDAENSSLTEGQDLTQEGAKDENSANAVLNESNQESGKYSHSDHNVANQKLNYREKDVSYANPYLVACNAKELACGIDDDEENYSEENESGNIAFGKWNQSEKISNVSRTSSFHTTETLDKRGEVESSSIGVITESSMTESDIDKDMLTHFNFKDEGCSSPELLQMGVRKIQEESGPETWEYLHKWERDTENIVLEIESIFKSPDSANLGPEYESLKSLSHDFKVYQLKWKKYFTRILGGGKEFFSFESLKNIENAHLEDLKFSPTRYLMHSKSSLSFKKANLSNDELKLSMSDTAVISTISSIKKDSFSSTSGWETLRKWSESPDVSTCFPSFHALSNSEMSRSTNEGFLNPLNKIKNVFDSNWKSFLAVFALLFCIGNTFFGINSAKFGTASFDNLKNSKEIIINDMKNIYSKENGDMLNNLKKASIESLPDDVDMIAFFLKKIQKGMTALKDVGTDESHYQKQFRKNRNEVFKESKGIRDHINSTSNLFEKVVFAYGTNFTRTFLRLRAAQEENALLQRELEIFAYRSSIAKLSSRVYKFETENEQLRHQLSQQKELDSYIQDILLQLSVTKSQSKPTKRSAPKVLDTFLNDTFQLFKAGFSGLILETDNSPFSPALNSASKRKSSSAFPQDGTFRSGIKKQASLILNKTLRGWQRFTAAVYKVFFKPRSVGTLSNKKTAYFSKGLKNLFHRVFRHVDRFAFSLKGSWRRISKKAFSFKANQKTISSNCIEADDTDVHLEKGNALKFNKAGCCQKNPS